MAINQVLREIEEKGLARSEGNPDDRRVRIAQLTDQGIQLATELEEVWDCIRASVGDAIQESGHDLMDAISRFELCLDRQSFRSRFKQKWSDAVEIIPFSAEHRDAFWQINSAWIIEQFVLEPIDERVLKNPESEIVDHGGAIFFARDRKTQEILGACALMEHGGEWEMTKMGVHKEARGTGVGQKLGEAVIALAKERGLAKIILETNSALKPAIQLYRKLGFVQITPTTQSDYARSDVKMELKLK